MWWYGNGWWWWWVAFVVIFFLIPLAYGWGYRGWGPWYRRRPPTGTTRENLPIGAGPGDHDVGDEMEAGWGWAGILLWFVLIIAIIWLIAAWGWGGRGGAGAY